MGISPRLLLRAPSSCACRAAHRAVRIENEMLAVRPSKMFYRFVFDNGAQVGNIQCNVDKRFDSPTVIIVKCCVFVMHVSIQRACQPDTLDRGVKL